MQGTTNYVALKPPVPFRMKKRSIKFIMCQSKLTVFFWTVQTINRPEYFAIYTAKKVILLSENVEPEHERQQLLLPRVCRLHGRQPLPPKTVFNHRKLITIKNNTTSKSFPSAVEKLKRASPRQSTWKWELNEFAGGSHQLTKLMVPPAFVRFPRGNKKNGRRNNMSVRRTSLEFLKKSLMRQKCLRCLLRLCYILST